MTEQTTTAATAPEDRPSWQTGPCPAWCSVSHREDDHPEDRVHDGNWFTVQLTTEDPETIVIDGVTVGADDIPELAAVLEQKDGGLPRVSLIHNGCHTVYMTPAEAAQAAFYLLSAAWMADPAALPQHEQVTTATGFFAKAAAEAGLRVPAPREDTATP